MSAKATRMLRRMDDWIVSLFSLVMTQDLPSQEEIVDRLLLSR